MLFRQTLPVLAVALLTCLFTGPARAENPARDPRYNAGGPADLAKMSQPQPGQPVQKIVAEPLVGRTGPVAGRDAGSPDKARIDLNYFCALRGTPGSSGGTVVNYAPLRVGGQVSVGLDVTPAPSIVAASAVPVYSPTYVPAYSTVYASDRNYAYFSNDGPVVVNFGYRPVCVYQPYGYAYPGYYGYRPYDCYRPTVVRPFFGFSLDFGFSFGHGRLDIGGFRHHR